MSATSPTKHIVGLRAKRAQGRATGGKIFGYKTTEIGSDRMDPYGKLIVAGYEYTIDDGEKRTVTSIFRMFTGGQGLHRIARSLNDRWPPTPRLGKKNDGGGWSHTTVRARSCATSDTSGSSCGTNPVAQGTGEPKAPARTPAPDRMEDHRASELAIISPDLWAKAHRSASGTSRSATASAVRAGS